MGMTTTTDTTLHKRLLDHLRTAVMLLDAGLVVRYLNPAAEMLLSTSATRCLGAPLPDYFFADHDVRAALAQCIANGHPFTRREAHLLVQPGTEVTVDYSVSQLNEPGQPPLLLVEMQPLDRLLRITREEAIRIFDKIRLEDPAGKIADDATMAAALALVRKGEYERADHFLTDLRPARVWNSRVDVGGKIVFQSLKGVPECCGAVAD